MAGDDTTERLEWRKIMENERRRKEGLEELKKLVESTGKQGSNNPHDLLKLLIKVGEIRSAEAASILMTDKKVLDQWTATLEKRGFIEVDGSQTPNETLKPTERLLNRVRAGSEKDKLQVLEDELEEEQRELSASRQELASERKERLNLEERLEKTSEKLKKRQVEIDAERDRAEELQKKLLELERQVKAGSEQEAEKIKTELGKGQADKKDEKE